MLHCLLDQSNTLFLKVINIINKATPRSFQKEKNLNTELSSYIITVEEVLSDDHVTDL